MRAWKIALLVMAAMAAGFALGVAEGEIPFTKNDIAGAEKLIALEFTDAERDSMQTDLADYRKGYEALRAVPIANDVPPALVFNPIPGRAWPAAGGKRARVEFSKPNKVKRPANLEDTARVADRWKIARRGSVDPRARAATRGAAEAPPSRRPRQRPGRRAVPGHACSRCPAGL